MSDVERPTSVIYFSKDGKEMKELKLPEIAGVQIYLAFDPVVTAPLGEELVHGFMSLRRDEFKAIVRQKKKFLSTPENKKTIPRS